MYEALLVIATIAVILLSLKLYFPFAEKKGMLAGVNHRSSHTKPVITGAGFIFYISYVFYIFSDFGSIFKGSKRRKSAEII
jgi:hypothetical protein